MKALARHLKYFAPAVQLGLTATPKRKDNVDTYAYFGEPVFVYSLKDGINDGFLTPFKVQADLYHAGRVRLHVGRPRHRRGGRDGKRYVERDFNKIIEIQRARSQPGTDVHGADRPAGKDARLLCDARPRAGACATSSTRSRPAKTQIIASASRPTTVHWANSTCAIFRTTRKAIPTILTTSQKLSTGVDARNVRNIVLMRPINSMIEFKQIIGRGTRLYRRQGVFHDLRLRESASSLQRSRMGRRTRRHTIEVDHEGVPCECRGDCESAISPPMETAKSASASAERKVKLADGKERSIQHMLVTVSGTPMARRCPRISSWKCFMASCPNISRTKQSCARFGASPTPAPNS